MRLGGNELVLGIMPESRLSSLSLSHRTCPLGLLAVLSSSVRDQLGWVYNEEVSGDILSEHPDLWREASVVLLSAHAGNINRCIVLARLAQADGKVVALGGPEPSMIGPAMLRDRPFFDALVVGPGEGVLGWLMTRTRPVPPGVFLPEHAMESLGSPEIEYKPPFRSIDFQNIQVDYGRLFDMKKHVGLSYLWGNDCAQARDRCFFCGRLAMGVGYRPSDKVWGELAKAYKHGILDFYNTTDSVTTNKVKFREFCEAKPSDMTEDTHRVFVNSRDVDEELVVSMRRLRGTAVIGIESFGRLAGTGKHRTSNEVNLRSVAILHAAGVKMVLSFVFGLPGETRESIGATEDGITKTVARYGDLIEAIHISPLVITSGSPAYRKLFKDVEVRRKYEAKLLPYDVIEMSEDYFARECQVTRRYCIERAHAIAEKIHKIAPHVRIGAKGILKSEERASSSAAQMGGEAGLVLLDESSIVEPR